MNEFVPRKLSNFLPDEEVDEYGFVWRIEKKEHTVEWVGYSQDGRKLGSFILNHDSSEEAKQRYEEVSWVLDRVEAMYPDGTTLKRVQEVIRKESEAEVAE